MSLAILLFSSIFISLLRHRIPLDSLSSYTTKLTFYIIFFESIHENSLHNWLNVFVDRTPDEIMLSYNDPIKTPCRDIKETVLYPSSGYRHPKINCKSLMFFLFLFSSRIFYNYAAFNFYSELQMTCKPKKHNPKMLKTQWNTRVLFHIFFIIILSCSIQWNCESF